MPPQTWEQLGIWLGTQFPVLAAAAGLIWWVLRWNGDRHAAEIARIRDDRQALLAEKDLRIADRDREIADLKAEVRELRGRLSRSRRRDGGTNEGQRA